VIVEFLHLSPQIACMYLHWKWSYSVSLLAVFISDALYFFTSSLLFKLSLLLFSWSCKIYIPAPQDPGN
jgi:hypothetical protein